ncbi:MAG TPA: hypothetical protein VN207_04875 [Ktedonobacteraceae bacterium]|nr:hypothetical protein [Ktedonobacteraceae bacterium]
MGHWDGNLKHLMNLAPEDFVCWLVGDAHFEGELSANFASREVDGDILWQIAINQELSGLHLELQAGPDSNMGRRLWEYNVEASIKYKQPVKSVVIYLRKPSSSKAEPPYQLKLPNGEVIHKFSFSVIELCKMEAEQLFQTGLKGLLPLVPLTQDGQQHDVVERVIDELQQPGVKKSGELLSLTYNLAGLVFEGDSEQLWLVRRFEMLKDILEESWTYQKIKKEGLEEGLEQGLQAQRQSLVLLVQTHYPALLQLAQEVCNAIRTLEGLKDLFQKVLLAKDELGVRQLLLSVKK